MAQRDATPAQLERLRLVRKEFGKRAVGTYRVDERTGIMRVELKCEAGLWHWWFDADGFLVDSALNRQFVLRSDS